MKSTKFSKTWIYPIGILVPLLILFVVQIANYGLADGLKETQLYAFPWRVQTDIYNYPIWLNIIHYFILSFGFFLIIKKPLDSIKNKVFMCMFFHIIHMGIMILNIGIDSGSV